MNLSNSFLEIVSVIGVTATVIALVQSIFDLVSALRHRAARRGRSAAAGYRAV